MPKMLAVAVLATLVGCEPEPGETRCSTTMVYGTAFTRCRTTPEDPPPRTTASPARGFWCTVRPDGFGVCAQGDRGAGACEAWRARSTDATYGPCSFASIAICAPTGCFTTPAACAEVERQAGRDGSACAVRR